MADRRVGGVRKGTRGTGGRRDEKGLPQKEKDRGFRWILVVRWGVFCDPGLEA